MSPPCKLHAGATDMAPDSNGRRVVGAFTWVNGVGVAFAARGHQDILAVVHDRLQRLVRTRAARHLVVAGLEGGDPTSKGGKK